MKILSLLLPVAVAAAVAALPTKAAASGWSTHYGRAVAEARAAKKPVLMYFTGSDFCPWCKKLDREVLDQPQFQAYARQNLVLLKLDFPARKPQSRHERAQNEELKLRYQITGFPTLILLDPDKRKATEVVYRRGGPKGLISQIEKQARQAR